MKLFNGMFNGQTVYQNTFCENLSKANCWILYRKGKDAKKRGLELAIKAFNEKPSQAPLHNIMTVAKTPSLRNEAKKFLSDYLDKFTKNKDAWSKQDGYHNKIVAALIVADFLRKPNKKREFTIERSKILKGKRW